MWTFLVTILLLFQKFQSLAELIGDSNNGYSDGVTNYIKETGHNFEVHRIQTADGYLLLLHRVLLKNPTKKPKFTVFLMHGLLSTANDYIFLQNYSLAHKLVTSGYDVWMGNSRGNSYGEQHVSMNSTDREFWSFSFHEIGYFDVPAMIDYALNVSQHKSLFYVGHSQGCNVILILLSMRPEYNRKVRQIHLLAPAAFLEPFRFELRLLLNYTERMLKQGVTNILYPVYQARPLAVDFCKVFKLTCLKIFLLIIGENKNKTLIDMNRMPDIIDRLSHYVSNKQFVHFKQLCESGNFQMFDYGIKNPEIYGKRRVPQYKLSRVSVPAFIYHGRQDGLIPDNGIVKLRKSLPNFVDLRVYDDYNHVDFTYAKVAKRTVYKPILKSFEKEYARFNKD